MTRRISLEALRSPFVAIDASSLRGDAFAWITGGIAEGEVLVVRTVRAFEGPELRTTTAEQVVERIAAAAHRIGARTVFGDQREEAALKSLFAQRELQLKSYAWTEQSKDDAVQLLRRLMRERRLSLPEHPKLRAELIGMKARLVPSGRIRYETNGLDYASCLITLCHAIGERHLRLSGRPADLEMYMPSGARNWRGVDSADGLYNRNRALIKKSY